DRRAQAIEILGRALGMVVARRQAEADPHHAVLQGEREQLVERVVLVAVPRRRGGEARGELVAPGAFHPTLGRPVLELGELRGDAAHVGRAAGLPPRRPGSGSPWCWEPPPRPWRQPRRGLGYGRSLSDRRWRWCSLL